MLTKSLVNRELVPLGVCRPEVSLDDEWRWNAGRRIELSHTIDHGSVGAPDLVETWHAWIRENVHESRNLYQLKEGMSARRAARVKRDRFHSQGHPKFAVAVTTIDQYLEEHQLARESRKADVTQATAAC
jgi:hypothetical protein